VTDRRRYALVGTGERGLDLFARAITTTHADVAELVGLHDRNRLRAEAGSRFCGGVPVFDTFDDMLGATRPHTVIVTSMDATHHTFIVAALEAGCDVVTEKPMTIGEEQCRAILDAERATGRSVRVAFNYRYAPVFTAMKEILAAGAIGEVRSLDFHWYLDASHGADYFRRWHRVMANAGGLFVHKATHHFDLVNWWLDDRPESVLADGSLRTYGSNGPFRSARCTGCTHAGVCPFFWDIREEPDRYQLYVEAEPGDGYIRDGCVFDPEVDIYDTMGALVRYRRGARMTYSLNAYCAYEGMRAAVNGANGRAEIEVIETRDADVDEIAIYRPRRAEPERAIGVPRTEGHGGGDERMLDDLFRGAADDPLGHAAGSLDGAYSILVGVAANRSVAEGGWVRIQDLLGAPV
jgi:predicted dehydrogenase